LSKTRKKYQFVVSGHVVMPEHIHLLIGEPQIANPSRVMQVLKQRVSLQCRARKRAARQQLTIFSERLPPAFWQPRSYDFNGRTKKKYIEKLNYIHMNPVRRGVRLTRWEAQRMGHPTLF
jgi:putative transposase